MTLKNIFKISIVLATFLANTAFAADQFFEVGKTYLFVPRMNIVMKGTVTQVTDNEIIFTNRYILKASKASANVKNDDAKAVAIRGAAIAAYLKSDKKDSLLEASPIKDIPTSYSRSEMTAIKIES
ncbi:MAG: hypothetical protein ACD_46C00531G0006 [uncultured bacterium]|nr:MAG: hypothetical protein ACD_46C00531G0006 [uncultured bacterium]